MECIHCDRKACTFHYFCKRNIFCEECFEKIKRERKGRFLICPSCNKIDPFYHIYLKEEVEKKGFDVSILSYLETGLHLI